MKFTIWYKVSLSACLSESEVFQEMKRLFNLLRILFFSTRLSLPENQSIQIPNNSGMWNNQSPLIIIISIMFQLLKSLLILTLLWLEIALRVLYALSHFILITLRQRYYYPNFTDKETEAWRSEEA